MDGRPADALPGTVDDADRRHEPRRPDTSGHRGGPGGSQRAQAPLGGRSGKRWGGPMRPMTVDQPVDWIRVRHLAGLGLWILRYGLAGLLLLWGSFKFAAFEAEAIRPLVENSPLLSSLYPLLGVRGTSSLIGVVEVGAALLIATPRWTPGLSAIGSWVAAATFFVTLSFLITTPEALSPTSGVGGFLLKDIILLGAAPVHRCRGVGGRPAAEELGGLLP
jgi:uncharacterized membrane protein YkgB